MSFIFSVTTTYADLHILPDIIAEVIDIKLLGISQAIALYIHAGIIIRETARPIIDFIQTINVIVVAMNASTEATATVYFLVNIARKFANSAGINPSISANIGMILTFSKN